MKQCSFSDSRTENKSPKGGLTRWHGDKESTHQCRRSRRCRFSPWLASLEKKMATHSSVLAWKIPWAKEPGGLQFTGLQRIEHDCVTEHRINMVSLPAEPQGKPKNSGVSSLSLLQGIFPTQESNWGLLHCRWILYQLSYEGSPTVHSAAAAAKSLQSCLTLPPHRRQSTRLRRPWDSPGKNTGVGYHFLLQCMKVKSESEVAQSCPTLHDPMDCSLPGSSVHGIFQARVLEWGAIAFSNSAF